MAASLWFTIRLAMLQQSPHHSARQKDQTETKDKFPEETLKSPKFSKV
ncbi:MAG: hypothetical protein ACKO2P_03845 [Planctomycetota bacterium]